jgi:hypothetical protein
MTTEPLIRKVESGAYVTPDGLYEVNLVYDEEASIEEWWVYRRVGGPQSIEYEWMPLASKTLEEAKAYLASLLAREEMLA